MDNLIINSFLGLKISCYLSVIFFREKVNYSYKGIKNMLDL